MLNEVYNKGYNKRKEVRLMYGVRRFYGIGRLSLERSEFVLFCHMLGSEDAIKEAIRSAKVKEVWTYDGSVVDVFKCRIGKNEKEDLLRALEDVEYIEFLKKEKSTIKFEKAHCECTYKGFKPIPFKGKRKPLYPLDMLSPYFTHGLKPRPFSKEVRLDIVSSG